MIIGGLQKTTLIDFPGKVACTVFTVGCNFACGYCHNPELLDARKIAKIIPENEFFDFLHTRKGKLDGVVITGGEPTLHKDLIVFIKKIKDLGYMVKLDTQGSNPNTLKQLIDDKLIDYVAMDIKTPLTTYKTLTKELGIKAKITTSIQLIMKSNISYEFRTTVVKEDLSPADIYEISNLILGAKKYYLQKFVPTKTLNSKYKNYTTYTDEELSQIASHVTKNVEYCGIR
ncbi:MAG: anaerobic ribonucleoside-triphosphate reductase activating protein [Patescibacteria group bacterium]